MDGIASWLYVIEDRFLFLDSLHGASFFGYGRGRS